MTVRYTKRALADLDHISRHIKRDNPRAAAAVGAHIEQAINNLELFPGAGMALQPKSVRRFVVGKYPYLIYYLIDEDGAVIILHIRHGARRDPDPDELTED